MAQKIDALVEGFVKLTPEQRKLLKQAQPELAHFIDQADEIYELELEKKSPTTFYLKQYITSTSSMLELKRKVEIVANEADPVLITGPTGTGKELLARALHGKREGKFIDVNCAGIPDQLIESELFGHVKGSFTDAKDNKEGMLEAAHDGTIFLDEIGDMPIGVQSKLLRSLQERKIRRVGSTEYIDISCRVVAATHQDLRDLISKGKFREDLFWRIAIIELETHGLSVRGADIPLLVRYYDKTKVVPDGLLATFCERFRARKDYMAGNVRGIIAAVRRYQLFKEMP